MQRSERENGAVLILVSVLALMAGAIAATYVATGRSYSNAASESFENEFAYRAANSGIAYYLGQLSLDEDYFVATPAPHTSHPLGGATFELESAVAGADDDQWDLVVRGVHRSGAFRLAGTVGLMFIEVPHGMTIGQVWRDPSQMQYTVANGAVVGGYNSTTGTFDPANPEDTTVRVNGSSTLFGGATIDGTLKTSGTFTGDELLVSGGVTQSAEATGIDSISAIWNAHLAEAAAANDNASLAAIFGTSYTPVSPSGDLGDLIVDGGTYTIPAGTYRFRRFVLRNGATVTFDTSSGPSRLVYLGNNDSDYDAGTGLDLDGDLVEDLQVSEGSSLLIDPGATKNGLMTVTSGDSNIEIRDSSVFGQVIGDPENGGLHQIVGTSTSGDKGADDRINVLSGSSAFGRLYTPDHPLFLEAGSRWSGSAVLRKADIFGTFAVDTSSEGRAIKHPSVYEVLTTWRAPPNSCRRQRCRRYRPSGARRIRTNANPLREKA
ncbi:MAG: hypothetical protein AAF517_17010, partial [Planctomycetota bacterium]